MEGRNQEEDGRSVGTCDTQHSEAAEVERDEKEEGKKGMGAVAGVDREVLAGATIW